MSSEAKEEDLDCPICSEKYNKTTRKKISCIKCELSPCIKCTKTFMGSLEEELKCMGCNEPLPIFHFVGQTPKTFFRRDLRNHNRDIAFKKEKSLLPATIPLVEIEKEKMRLYKENEDIMGTINVLKEQINGLYRQRQTNFNRIYYGLDSEKIKGKEKRSFTRPCPMDDCRGFLSSRWKCAICDVKVCSDCLQPIEGEHKCNADDVESAKIISSHTKPCPECGARIMKSEGCDHMWCTACDTGFSWRTGMKISNSKNTNPFYYEWLRQNGGSSRTVGDVRCGGAPGVNELEAHLDRYDTKGICFYRLHQSLMHIYHIELDRYNPANLPDNSDLRVAFLMNRISENYWKETLGARLKKSEKFNDIYQTLNMYHETMSEFLIQLVRTEDPKLITDLCISIKNFRKYTNTQFKRLVEIYNNVMPYIDKNWSFTSIDARLSVRVVRPAVRYTSRNRG